MVGKEPTVGTGKKGKIKYLLIVDPTNGLAIVLKIAGLDYTLATGSVVRITPDRIATRDGQPLVVNIGEIPARQDPVVSPGNANITSAPAPFVQKHGAVRIVRAGTIRPAEYLLGFIEYGGCFFTGVGCDAKGDKFLSREGGASL